MAVAMAARTDDHLKDGPVWFITMVMGLVVFAMWPADQNITRKKIGLSILVVAYSNHSVLVAA